MELQTRNLIIDTQYFVENIFDFNKKELLSLRNLIDRGSANLYLTDITVAEVRKQIREKLALAFDKFNKNDTRFLKPLPVFKKILEEYNEEKCVKEVLLSFENFLDQWKVKIISSNQVSFLHVHEMYAGLKAPFSAAKRKEFPDAFALEAIKIWRDDKNESAYLLSEDNDWQRYIKEHKWGVTEKVPSLFYLEELSTFIDSIVRTEEELIDQVKYADKVLNKQWDLIKAKILEEFKYLEFKPQYPEEEEIDSIFPIDCKIAESDILSTLEDMAFYELSLEIDVIIKYSAPNYGNAFYDKEDDTYYNLTYIERYVRATLLENCQVDFSYENGLERNFKLLSVEFENEEIRVPINLEERIDMDEWTNSPKVVVCGVKENKITQNNKEKMEFENFAQAKKAFRQLDIFRESGDFTAALAKSTDGKIEFQSWESVIDHKEVL